MLQKNGGGGIKKKKIKLNTCKENHIGIKIFLNTKHTLYII